MSNIYFFSGACGCGKTTLANAFAKHMVNNCGKRQIYVIHGDDFHAGFVETDNKDRFFVAGQPTDILRWDSILKFNWECIIDVAEKCLQRRLDVVLTASEQAIKERIALRGDTEMVERALFLKNKLDVLPENQGHLFDNTNKAIEQEVVELIIENFEVGKEI